MTVTESKARTIFFFSMLTSIALVFWRLGTASFWFDEAYTSALVRSDVSTLLSHTAADVHPPLYYLLLKGWAQIFGFSDVALRSFSALLMLASVFMVMVLAKRLMERRHAYLVASFAALSPFTIRFAQETRMYALVSLLLVGATYLFVIQMQRKRRERSWKIWILYVLLLTAALYTHYFSILILAAHMAYALFHDTRTKDGKTWLIRLKNRISLIDRRLLKSLLLIPVLYAPWLPTLIDQTNAVNDGFWIPNVGLPTTVSLFSMLSVFVEIEGYSGAFWIAVSLIAVAAWQILYLARRAKAEEKKTLWFLMACIVFPALLLALISIAPGTTSYFYWRYFAQFSLFYYTGVMFIGLLMTKYNKGIWGPLFVTSLVIMSTVGTVRVLDGVDKDNITTNEVFPEVLENFEDGDVIVADGTFRWFVVDHYNTTDTPTYYLDSGYMWGSQAPIYEDRDHLLFNEDFSDVTSESGRVWLALSQDIEYDIPESWTLLRQVDGATTAFLLYEVN